MTPSGRTDRQRPTPRHWWQSESNRSLVELALDGGRRRRVHGLRPRQLHANLILENNTPTGGDLGAHVWGPAYLRDHILPHWRLSGWAPDWYAGFPMYKFYMVVPALLMVLLDVVLPYGVALKIVSALGHRRAAVVLLGVRQAGRAAVPDPPAVRDRRRSSSCSTRPSRSTAATWRRRWRASSPSPSPSASPCSTSACSRGACAPGRVAALAASLFALAVLCHLHRRHLRRGRHGAHVPAVGRSQAHRATCSRWRR